MSTARIKELRIRDYYCIEDLSVEIELDKEPVILVCGKNGAGKSAVHRAIRAAHGLDPESWNYKVVREGCASTRIVLNLETEQREAYLKKGAVDDLRGTPIPEADIPLGGGSFFDIATDADERRKTLYRLSNQRVTESEVVERLEKIGVKPVYVAQVKPLLSGGFAAAQKELKETLRAAKSDWCKVTGAQRYTTHSRAAEWSAPKNSLHLANEAARLAEDIRNLDEICQLLGPHGVPAEMAAALTAPINIFVESYSPQHWWKTTIGGEMGIRYGMRDYDVLSSSERLRARFMVACAMAHRSGRGLVSVDNVMTSLDPAERGLFVGWLVPFAQKLGLQIWIYATLKQPFRAEGIKTIWM